jgi:YacP-like NYN domain
VSSRGVEPIVLVDARNVVRSRWPNIPEERFVALARTWAERERVEAWLVFDGPVPGGRLGSHAVDEGTTLVGTGQGSADDWIAAEARRLAASSRPVWVVTSDRELRRRIAPYAVRVDGGGSFATQLESLERDVGATS